MQSVSSILTQKPDRLFSPESYPKSFEFNEEVAAVFDDMITRSVPFYSEVHKLILEYVESFYQEGSYVYDLGCSTGLTLEYLFNNTQKNLKAIGIDSSQPMIQQAQNKLAPFKGSIELVRGDMRQIEFHQPSIFIINYALQFLPVQDRIHLLRKVYQSLPSKGALILSEKTDSCSSMIQNLTTEIYEDHKYQQNYSALEIRRKKEALDQVLIPLTFNEQVSMLYEVGFHHVQPIFVWNNFCSLICQKS